MSETFGELIARVSDFDIIAALRIIDPHNIEGYEELLPQLRLLSATNSNCQIILSMPPDWDGEVDVSGRENGEGDNLSIEFVPWNEWFGMAYRVSGCDLSEAQIVGWCLNEMTWAGWNQDDISDNLHELIALRNEALAAFDHEEGGGP